MSCFVVGILPKEIRCKDGPHVFEKWLGVRFDKPWIKLKKCISHRCKPSVEKEIVKVKLDRNTGKYERVNATEHVKCRNE